MRLMAAVLMLVSVAACGSDGADDAQDAAELVVETSIDDQADSSGDPEPADESEPTGENPEGESQPAETAPLADGLATCDEQYQIGNVVTAEAMSAGCVLPDGSISVGVLECSDGTRIWTNEVDRWAVSGQPVQETTGSPVDDVGYTEAFFAC